MPWHHDLDDDGGDIETRATVKARYGVQEQRWNQRGNFESRGVSSISSRAIRHQARSASPPSEMRSKRPWPWQSVRAAGAPAELQRLGGQPRNVHGCPESFWDAACFTGSGRPRIRRSGIPQVSGRPPAIRMSCRRSRGYCQPRVQVLCGPPVTENFVFLRRACATRWPACRRSCAAGHRSIASHPTLPGSEPGKRLPAHRFRQSGRRGFCADDLNGD
jgi:hypothetical protein